MAIGKTPLRKEFNGEDRYIPITCKENWAVVREVAEKTCTLFNRLSYKAESRRKADAAAKRAAEAAAKAVGQPAAPKP